MKHRFILLALMVMPLMVSAQSTIKGRQLYYVKNYSESQAKAYFDNAQDLDPIEGIWICNGFKFSIEKDYYGYTRNPNKFRAVIIGFPNQTIVDVGEIRFFLEKGATNGVYSSIYYLYRASWERGQRHYNVEPFSCVSVMDTPISFTSKLPILDGDYGNIIGYDTDSYVKVYPPLTTSNSTSSVENEEPTEWSGSGFALNNGYFVTNYHVIEDAKSITVKGVKGNFNIAFETEVVATDKYNDLALLRINDGRFTDFGSIPYKVKTSTSEVGEDIFVLGYPLTSTMGDEIKLTTGVISSKTGFQGDVSLYQISAPVQPGNSGGPLFDSKGNLIGIVSSKHMGAESVGYAIKTSYLMNLVESALSSSIIPVTNTISGQPLTGKVKAVKDFVFMIECSSGTTHVKNEGNAFPNTSSATSPANKTIFNPSVSFNRSGLVIKSVILTDDYTAIEIEAKFTNYAWCNINAGTYILANGKKSTLVRTDGISISPQKTYFNYSDITFTLYFPPISTSTTEIDLIESGESTWKIYGIKLEE